ncbi:uncharacterized protein LOC127265499 [Andrographis paniculata]|uniref:uncharacterized protein LOC127265499 n=1 Tax=Andrographis paniculata TaxID=175694 RepID=UPI0021E71619|nr:uncharacterized protein LOC127265499 [Andrographis paniculata]
MDERLHNLVFSASPQSNAFENMCNSIQVGGTGDVVVYSAADTTLRLNSPGFVASFPSAPKGVKRKWNFVNDLANQNVKSSLGLGLGHSSSSSDSKGSLRTACASVSSSKETEEKSSMDIELDFTLHLGSDKSSDTEKSASSKLKVLNKWPKVDLQLSLSSGPTLSDVSSVHPGTTPPKSLTTLVHCGGLSLSEGSAGNPLVPFQTASYTENIYFLNQSIGQAKPTSPGLIPSITTTPKSSVTCTSGVTQLKQQRSNCTKQCQFQGCLKGARGASGFCIGHGGGRRCLRSGCDKGAEGRTAFCKAHGGGRRCEFLGCTKSAEGRTDFCIAHGGGRRCSNKLCTRAARGKSGLCIRHGGGKRCKREHCKKSAEGVSGLCIAHGGGRRCQYLECNKGAQGSTMFCKAHGGGKRCSYPDCKKGAEGSTPFCKGHGGGKRCSFQEGGVCPKSVHGGTLFCVAHGGGKRCAVPGCTKSARGRTNFCVRHGGGKRCKFEGCGKSAQGSTDFCKAHGGGKRCLWGNPGSGFGQGDIPCSIFSRGKMGLCALHGALVQDKRVHGGETMGIATLDSKSQNQIFSAEDLNVDTPTFESNIVSSISNYHGQNLTSLPIGSNPSSSKVPEGRVHGANLMARFACNSGYNFSSSRVIFGSSMPEKTMEAPQNWM